MLRNYVRIALRNLWKNRLFSARNIVGIGIGRYYDESGEESEK